MPHAHVPLLMHDEEKRRLKNGNRMLVSSTPNLQQMLQCVACKIPIAPHGPRRVPAPPRVQPPAPAARFGGPKGEQETILVDSSQVATFLNPNPEMNHTVTVTKAAPPPKCTERARRTQRRRRTILTGTQHRHPVAAARRPI